MANRFFDVDVKKELTNAARSWLNNVRMSPATTHTVWIYPSKVDGVDPPIDPEKLQKSGKETSMDLPMELILAETCRLWDDTLAIAAANFPNVDESMALSWLIQVHLDGIFLDPRRSVQVLECLNTISRLELSPILHKELVSLTKRIARSISRPADGFNSLLAVPIDSVSVQPILSRSYSDKSMKQEQVPTELTVLADSTWQLHLEHRISLLMLLHVLMLRMIPGKSRGANVAGRPADLNSLLTGCSSEETMCWHRYVRWFRATAMDCPSILNDTESDKWQSIEKLGAYVLSLYYDAGSELLRGTS
eukprot:SAG31_NODE_468_length_15250_cov_5.304138_5_plen_306_part_00